MLPHEWVLLPLFLFVAAALVPFVSGAGLRSPSGVALSPAEFEDAEEVQVEGGFVPVGFRRSMNLLTTASEQLQSETKPYVPPSPPPPAAPSTASSPAPGFFAAPLFPGPYYSPAASPLGPAPSPYAPSRFPVAMAFTVPGPAPRPFAAPSPAPAPSSLPSAPLGLRPFAWAPPAPSPFRAPAPSPLQYAPMPMPVFAPAAVPAFAPAFAPAPVPPAPAPAPAPASGNATVTFTIENLVYWVIAGDPVLRAGLEETLKADIAASTGNGVTPADVSLAFSEGSVIVEATISAPATGAVDAETLQDSLCSHGAELDADMTTDIGAISGMSQGATGAISIADMNACGTAATTPAVVTPLVAYAPSSNVTAPASLDDCNPGCIEGHGICSDNLCFCKTPYTGVQCERALSTTQIYRIKYAMASGIFTVALILGATLGTVFWHMVLAPRYKKPTNVTVQAVKTETWEPAKN